MPIRAIHLNVILFMLLALLPSIISITFSVDTGTHGLVLAAMIVSPALLRYVKSVRVPINWIIIIGLIFIWILVLSPMAAGVNYSSKPLFSLLIAVFLLCLAFLIEAWFERCNDHRLYRLVQIVCVIFMLIGWSGFIFDPTAFGYGWSGKCFPFGEPAHFAKIAGPIYVVAFFLVQKKFKLLIFTNAALQAILLPSTSMLFYTAIILVIVLQVRSLRIMAPVILVLAVMVWFVILNPSYLEYHTGRITLSPESGNLTSLVMLQGAFAAKNALVDTGGLGLGFQMLGTEAPNEISAIIAGILSNGGELCRTDGGFVAAKLIAELGLAGVVLAVLALAQMIRSGIWLRSYWKMRLKFKADLPDHYLKSVITNSLITTFFIEMFLRGGGYFSLTAVLFIISLLYVRKSRLGLEV